MNHLLPLPSPLAGILEPARSLGSLYSEGPSTPPQPLTAADFMLTGDRHQIVEVPLSPPVTTIAFLFHPERFSPRPDTEFVRLRLAGQHLSALAQLSGDPGLAELVPLTGLERFAALADVIFGHPATPRPHQSLRDLDWHLPILLLRSPFAETHPIRQARHVRLTERFPVAVEYAARARAASRDYDVLVFVRDHLESLANDIAQAGLVALLTDSWPVVLVHSSDQVVLEVPLGATAPSDPHNPALAVEYVVGSSLASGPHLWQSLP